MLLPLLASPHLAPQIPRSGLGIPNQRALANSARFVNNIGRGAHGGTGSQVDGGDDGLASVWVRLVRPPSASTATGSALHASTIARTIGVGAHVGKVAVVAALETEHFRQILLPAAPCIRSSLWCTRGEAVVGSAWHGRTCIASTAARCAVSTGHATIAPASVAKVVAPSAHAECLCGGERTMRQDG